MDIEWIDEAMLMTALKTHLDVAVFGVLGVMSFFMVAYVVERMVFFARVDVSEFVDRPSLDVVSRRHPD